MKEHYTNDFLKNMLRERLQQNGLQISTEIEQHVVDELIKAYIHGRKDSMTLLNSLHRRVQESEGAEIKVINLKQKLRRQRERFISLYREETSDLKKEIQRLRKIIDNLPFFVKWMIK